LKRFSLSFLAILMLFAMSVPAFAEAYPNAQEKLVVIQGSKQMIHNSRSVLATQPLTVVKGVTYVSARSFVNEIYGTIGYNTKTKQYILSNGSTELRFTAARTAYTLDGTSQKGIGAPFVLKGSLMVPLRTVSQHFGLKFTAFPKEKKIELTWEAKPVAKFEMSSLSPYAGQTEVSYTDLSYHPRGLQIVDERWENNDSLFEQQGKVTVTHWVQDESGVWSDPYSITITVKAPNQPPVAGFVTDKNTYKMGEYITYADQSYDDENLITERVWNNNEKAFFEPGEQTITLKVTDANGAVDEFSKTITILNETLYTREEFNLVYTEVGEKFPINGKDVLSLPKMNYFINPQQETLIRANSPETIKDEGIYYEDVVSGDVRFLVHNYNGRSTPAKVYIIATNENAVTANIGMGPVGIGGPNPYVTTVGRAATARFLESRMLNRWTNVQIPAGKSKVIVTQFSDKTLKPGDVLSMYADVKMDQPLRVKVVVVNADRNVMTYLPYLPLLPSHDRHIRGTFEEADRLMIVNQTIGDVKSRMVLTDNVSDVVLPGVDKTTGTPVNNAGNYGTMYTIRLNNVQPHTAIVVNPRGGHYAGAFNVNGKLVYTTNTSNLRDPNEVGVLHKTGDSVESVTIIFTPANGSMLPINLLFMPMPR
jgi:hypothetical protein